jgi:hypothetical protein
MDTNWYLCHGLNLYELSSSLQESWKNQGKVLLQGTKALSDLFFIFLFFFLRQGSCYIVQAGLKLLSSSNPPTSTSLVTRTTDMHHLSFLDSCYYCYNTVYTRYKQNTLSLSVWVHACNPSTKESEAGRLWVWGQTALHKETLSNKRTTKTTKPSLSFPN